MDNSKGKEKAPPPQPPRTTQTPKSLATRVVDSATSLAKDFVSSASASATTADLASASTSDKSHSSAPISAQAGESSTRFAARPHEASFRSRPSVLSPGHATSTLDDEFDGPGTTLDSILSAAQPNSNSSQPTTTSQDVGQQWADTFSSTTSARPPLRFTTDILDSQIKALLSAPSASNAPDAVLSRALRAYGIHAPRYTQGSQSTGDMDAAISADGNAVSALLSSSTTTDDVYAPTAQDLHEPSVEEVFGGEAGTWQTRSETRGFFLPPAPTYRGVDESVDVVRLEGEGEDLQGVLARRWLREWGAVMRRYTDEVWGDAEAEIVEALEGLEDNGEGGSSGDQPMWVDATAVRRLGMILGHLKMEYGEDSMDYPTSLSSLGKD